MRKHLSILALWVRSSFWWAAGISAVTAAVQVILMSVNIGAVRTGEISTFHELTGKAGIIIPHIIGMLSVWCCLIKAGARGGRETLGRLSVGEVGVTLWQAAANTGALLVFWAFEVAAALVGFRVFSANADPAAISGQSLFIAAHIDPLLHWLLPLEDLKTALWAIIYYPALGFITAADTCRSRRGGRAFAVSSLIVCLFAAVAPSEFPLLMAIFTVAVVIVRAARLGGIDKGGAPK